MSLRVWLTRSQHGGVKEQMTTYEKGSYNAFDSAQWRKVPEELKLKYEELELRPKLPDSLLPSSAHQIPQSTSVDLSLIQS
ncbi:unnamed protein product [Toxocara canis]|uniref:NOT2_3_5 domain-containing protein n=1 Tax=Toxocara canis TaxID=6265 RepID=A0A183UWS4_TOXCA|nr:unnamed protein product [Toxocara canis]